MPIASHSVEGLPARQHGDERLKQLERIVTAFRRARSYLVIGCYPLHDSCECPKCQAIRLLDEFTDTEESGEAR